MPGCAPPAQEQDKGDIAGDVDPRFLVGAQDVDDLLDTIHDGFLVSCG